MQPTGVGAKKASKDFEKEPTGVGAKKNALREVV
jgi:hypothetical protein